MSTISLRTGLATCAVLLLLAACEESNPTDPDHGSLGLSVAMQEDVEALIAGSMAGWWRAAHGFGPAPALSTAADAHSSSWRNWGMLHAGQEPRQDLSSLEPQFVEYVSDRPWTELYRSLVSARDGMLALSGGGELGSDSETLRAVAFARFVQGLSLGTLAQLFDEAWIVDETVDPADVELSPYPEVMAAALAKLDRAVELAGEGEFTIPAEWVGFHRTLDQDEFARLARSWRARLRVSAARTSAEGDAVDWTAVLTDAREGIRQDWAGEYDGDWENNWAWDALKIFGGHPAWGRMDYRTVGPADASGAWEEWIATTPSHRTPFRIDTDDSRVTGGSPTADGTYVGYDEEIVFRPGRGRDHFSYYTHRRWAHLWEVAGEGIYVDFPVKELAFLEAEALLRLGDRTGAMSILNDSRARGGLPPFTDPEQSAPGGDRCVPQRPDGTCGDLWDAFRYEKRLEIFHHGPFTEYLDARRWGTLVPGTFTSLPRPDVGLPELLAEFYAAAGAAEATRLSNASSAEDLDAKLQGVLHFDRARNANPGNAGAG